MNELAELKFARMDAAAILPSRKHPTDAGLDLFALVGVVISPHSFAVVGTGVCMDLPAGWVGLILSKSRSNFLLGGGVVDAGYQGEIRIKVMNPTSEPLVINKGQAIAQLLIVPIATPQAIEVSMDTIYSEKSERGASGGIHLSV